MSSTGLVVANWKLNGSQAMATDWLAEYALLSQDHDLSLVRSVVCPPFPYVPLLSASQMTAGAQDVSLYEQGAYTGDVSAEMLADFQVTYAIVGHSERRALFGETDVDVAKKAQLLLAKGIKPIICVGESQAQREANQTFDVVGQQLSALLEILTVADLAKVAIAYEPIWAIGTGKTATAEQANEVHQWIYDWASRQGMTDEQLQAMPVIYGGSVKPENAADLFSMSAIKGALVGGASLKPNDFFNIVKAWHDR